jgi:hypothetical protein
MGPQESLNAFLKDVADRPFQWHVWDCSTFTNEAWRAMHGVGWADDWLGRYTEGGLYLRRDALRREFGFRTLDDAIDHRLTRVSGLPPRGALVVTEDVQVWVIGAALGISLGLRAAFLGKHGVTTLSINQVRGGWL